MPVSSSSSWKIEQLFCVGVISSFVVHRPGVRFNRLRAMVRALPGAMVGALPTVYTDTGAEVGVPHPWALMQTAEPRLLLNKIGKFLATELATLLLIICLYHKHSCAVVCIFLLARVHQFPGKTSISPYLSNGDTFMASAAADLR